MLVRKISQIINNPILDDPVDRRRKILLQKLTKLTWRVSLLHMLNSLGTVILNPKITRIER